MKHILKAALLASALVTPTVHADFSGAYAIGLWDIVENGGSVDISGAPAAVSFVSNNIGTTNANQDLTFTAFENATVSFDWTFSTVDSGTFNTEGAQWDPFGYLLDGTFFQLTDNNGPDDQNGSASFAVTAGQIFGFRSNTVDGIEGAATSGIANFVANGPAPALVPLPPAVGLLGAALSSLLLTRRRRTGDERPMASA